MKPRSLTLRLSLLFVAAVAVVLVVVGLAFDALSRHHFHALDIQLLKEKLAAVNQIASESAADPDELRERWHTLLGAHPDLSVLVLAADGTPYFSEPAGATLPPLERERLGDGTWEWMQGHHRYKAISAPLFLAAGTPPLTLWLRLDVTTHAHFFTVLQRWFWIVLAASTLLSAALGWLVARNGLKPVRTVTQTAASMSAGSLKRQIPLEPVPDELRELIMAFNAMLGRLDDSFARLSNFSADIAHELRTPISNLRTHTEVVLAQPRTPEVYEENLQSNLEELNRLSTLIDRLLLLAKADHGLIALDRQPLELRTVVQKLFDYYELLAEDQGVELHLSGDGRVLGDSVMLQQVVANLLSNALRHTPGGGRIFVTLAERGQQVELVVENPGRSIAPEHLDHLFDRFYRADPTRREGQVNAGLGLAIARSLMESHGGSIHCTSAEGRTRFTLIFPRLTPATIAARP
ncbi:heavy metal sensor histidine kinase [Pseudomonas rhizoryzae]|uniref:heavy metal sensor histidine kinase n=1 Tax=Pseudomonas rhizoryzae TaxID=2571129 RepID=UPI0007374DD7|nr:heavy metal sensor histidine kinase [Pseudomonas rhizoryzae]KTT28858.1 ATPase [Pseudomonas psychrotolerans]KTT71066.1 ATPase [Pseudomonas psychrotolerans]